MDIGHAHFGPGTVALLLLAGVGAGITGSTAGLASLISYPALLAIGLPPVTANVTNTVALIGSSIGSVSGSRRELSGQGADIRRWIGISAAGGVAGAALLLLGPAGTFQNLVPYLIAGACALLLASPRLRAIRAGRSPTVSSHHHPYEPNPMPHPARGATLPIALFFTCLYGGYFGAAAGVMILALLLFATDKALPAANALKNLLLGVANAVAAVGFVVFADVRWAAAIPLGLGCILGGAIGPAIVRRVPPTLMRTVIAVAGFALAVKLWLN